MTSLPEDAEGVYLSGLPSTVTTEYMLLYFENKKSGGNEYAIIEEGLRVFTREDGTTCGIVKINDRDVTANILSKPEHRLAGQVISVEPYIPRVHDKVSCNRAKNTDQRASRASAEYGEDDSQDEDNKEIQPELTSSTEQSRITLIYEGSEDKNNESDCPSECGQKKAKRGRGKRNRGRQVPAKDTHSDSQAMTEQENIPKKAQGRNMNWRQARSQSANKVTQQTSFQLRETKISQNDKPLTMSGGGACFGRNAPNRGAVPLSNDNVFAFKEECPVTHSDLVMLRISAFPRKFSSQDIRIKLIEKSKSVQLECTSEELLKETKMKMLQDLNRVEVNSIQLPKPKCQYLERSSMKEVLKEKCIKGKLYVHFEVNIERNQLLCYGLSSRDVNNGLDFLQRSWHRRTIKLRPGQHDTLKSEAWNSLHRNLNLNVALCYVDEDTETICLECLFEETHVQNALRRLIGFLKSTPTVGQSSLQLQGPKAEFFKRHLEDDLEGTVRLQRGTLNVVCHRANTPLTIRVSVQGNSAIVAEVQARVDQITIEAISFDRMTSDDASVFQIMKGLDTTNGRDFLAEFEMLHDCVVDVQKEGRFCIERQRVYDLFDVAETEEEVSRETTSLQPRASPSYEMKPTRIEAGALRRFSSLQDVQLPKKSPYSPPHSNEYQLAVDSVPVSFVVGRTKVDIKRGYIQKEKADGIVNIASPSWNIQESMVSKAILKAAGPVLLQDFMLQVQQTSMSPDGSNVIDTDAHDMVNCRRLFHIRMDKGAPHCRQSIRSVMKELNQLCTVYSVTSVAIPPLGVGRMYQYDPTKAASYMRDYIEKYLPAIKKLSIVVYRDDEKTYNTFVRIFGQKKESPTGFGTYNSVSSTSDLRDAVFDDHIQRYKAPQVVQRRLSREAIEHDYDQPLRPRPGRNRVISSFDSRMVDELDFLQNARTSAAHLPERAGPIKSAAVPSQGARPSSLARGFGRDPVVRPSSYTRESDVDLPVSRSPTTTQPVKQKHSVTKVPKYVQEKTISNLRLSVCARHEDACQKAKHELEKKIPKEFLYEKTIKNVQRFSVSKASLNKLETIVEQSGIRAVRDNDIVYLRGYRQSVERVFSDIMEVLLQESSTQEAKPQSKPKPQKGTTEYIQSMAYDTDPEVPLHWKHFPPRELITTVLKTIRYDETVKYKKVRLSIGDAATQAIAMMIQQTFRPELIGQGRDAIGLGGYTQLNVLSVERIENLELFNEYALQRKALFQSLCTKELKKFPAVESLPGSSGPVKLNQINDFLGEVHPEVNEVYLFHGTRPENIQSICNKGLDSRLSGDRTMFGQGVYGAETSIKADQYVDAKDNRTAGKGNIKKMFVIRVLLGDCYLCSTPNPPKFRTPPCSTCMQPACKQHSSMFDSVLGDCGLLNREFVVYKQSQCYPEYLVSYERV